jgi:hypothetical protein
MSSLLAQKIVNPQKGNRFIVTHMLYLLKTTQGYLGKVSDSEAIRRMDVLHGK